MDRNVLLIRPAEAIDRGSTDQNFPEKRAHSANFQFCIYEL